MINPHFHENSKVRTGLVFGAFFLALLAVVGMAAMTNAGAELARGFSSVAASIFCLTSVLGIALRIRS